MPSRKCCVPCCGYRQYSIRLQPNRRSLFSLPKDERKSRLWIENIPGMKTKELPKASYVCDIHFESRFLTTGRLSAQGVVGKKFILKSEGYPTLFMHPHDFARANLDDPLCDVSRPTIYDNSENEVSAQDSDVTIYSSPDLFYEPNSTFSYESSDSASDPPSVRIFGNNSDLSFAPNSDLISDLSSIKIASTNTQIETTLYNTYSGSLETSNQPLQLKTTLQDALLDLTASEHTMLDIKKEWLDYPEEVECRLKVEGDEDQLNTSGELSVYEEIKNNASYYASFIPKFWKIYDLLLENNEVLAFSKTTDTEICDTSICIREKNIILDKKDVANFSVAGQTLTSHGIFFSMKITSIETFLQMILQFDASKICQGICTNEFDVDKEDTIYKDNLGLYRHNFCTLITETKQCTFCKDYNQ